MKALFMVPVQSSAIRAIGFDGFTLAVRFHGGDTIYEHVGVPLHLYLRFMAASSKGTFYAYHFRGKYRKANI